MKNNLVLALITPWFVFTQLSAQVTHTGSTDSIKGGEQVKNLSIGGYIDSYMGYNFSQPKDGNNPYFVSMGRHNEATINLAYLDLKYSADRVRARFVPGIGTYMNANYALEPGLMKNFVEASIGYQISAKKNIWIDFGILGSPYTNESAISKDHLMYTRSFAPEYVPYYLAGAKISFPFSKKLNGYVYLLNGWQQIQDQNSGKSIGTQIEYKPNDKNLFNWNTYLGDERSSSSPNNRMRYFTDIYWIYNPDGVFSITSCGYIGIQEQLVSNSTVRNRQWWQLNFIGRLKLNKTASLSGRIEYFSDPNSVQIIPITSGTGFNSYSSGLCFNLKLSENLLFRLEGRHFRSDKSLYLDLNNRPSNQSFWCISNLTVWF